VIDIDKLHIVREGGEVGLEVGVVHSRTTMENEADLLLLHGAAIGHEPSPLDIEVEIDAIDLREHAPLLEIHTEPPLLLMRILGERSTAASMRVMCDSRWPW
jgi:hypothetical protein